MLQDYWRNQQSTRLTVAQKKRLAGLPVAVEDYDQYDNTDYQALAQELREAEDHEALSNRHSCESRNPAGQGADGINTPSPLTGEGWDGGEKSSQHTSSPAPTSDEFGFEDDLDDQPDYYIEPPSPEVQAAFDHEMRIETGGYPEGEIPDEPPPPPPGAYATFEAELKRVREAATRDGVPVLPNPLASKLRDPTIRGP